MNYLDIYRTEKYGKEIERGNKMAPIVFGSITLIAFVSIMVDVL